MTTAPQRLRALLAEPGLVVMPAVWDGLTAKLTYGEGFKTAFLSGSCVAASRLGGPDLDLISDYLPKAEELERMACDAEAAAFAVQVPGCSAMQAASGARRANSTAAVRTS